MRKIGLLTFLLALPSSAHAIGVGTTYGLGSGTGLAGLGNLFGGGGFTLATSMGFLPTLDLVPGGATVQIHVLETLGALSNEEIFLGANAYFNVVQSATSGTAVGVVEPGFGIDLNIDPVVLVVTGECRFGLTNSGDMSYGVYVVPALGIAVGDTDTDLVVAGTVQFSVWFGS